MIFDFDETIISKDSDFAARTLIHDDLPDDIKQLWSLEDGCILYMQKVFKLLHTNGISQESIVSIVKEIQPIDGIVNLMKNLNSNNCEIIIISDANVMFIEKWLVHWNLNDTVKKIFSNPAWFDDDGLLNIENYHHQNWCKLSVKNLCKGDVMDKYIKQRHNEGVVFNKIGYVGDGSNDFCPMIRLSIDDMIFPRINYPIMKQFNNRSDNLTPKAEIIPWKNGDDIWQEIKKRISII